LQKNCIFGAEHAAIGSDDGEVMAAKEKSSVLAGRKAAKRKRQKTSRSLRKSGTSIVSTSGGSTGVIVQSNRAQLGSNRPLLRWSPGHFSQIQRLELFQTTTIAYS
jgi:hypothetical protein